MFEIYEHVASKKLEIMKNCVKKNVQFRHDKLIFSIDLVILILEINYVS